MKNMWHTLTAVVLALALSACAFYPKTAVNLRGELPGKYIEQQEDGEVATVVDRWWEQFNDEQLNRMMAQMFRQNLQLEQSYARLQQVQATVKSVRSARFPSLAANGQAATFAARSEIDNEEEDPSFRGRRI